MSKINTVTKTDLHIEKLILQGCIVDPIFLRELIQPLKLVQLEAPEINLCVTWIIDYYKETGEAPKKHIRELVELHSKSLDDFEYDLLHDVISSTLKEYKNKSFNREYVRKKALKHLNTLAFTKALSKAQILLDRGEFEQAKALVDTNTQLIKENMSEIYDLNDPAHVDSWWGKTELADMRFNNALDSFMPPIFRGKYYALYGRAKVGKSYWLMYIAQKGAELGLNVLIYTLEMALEEYDQRWSHMLIGKKFPTAKNPNPSKYTPLPEFDCLHNQKGTCKHSGNDLAVSDDGNLIGPWDSFKRHKPCIKCLLNPKNRKKYEPATWLKNYNVGVATKEEVKKIKQQFSLHTGGQNKVKIAPYLIGQCTPEHVRNDLAELEEKGWYADLVVYDYPQIFKLDKNKERRIALGETHEELSSLAKEKKHIAFAGIQANRSGNTSNRLTTDHLAEDISAIFTVDCIVAINSCDFEFSHYLETDRYWKRQRLELLACRYEEIPTNRQLLSTESRDIGQIFLDGILINAKG